MSHIMRNCCNEHTEILEVGYKLSKLFAHSVRLEQHLSEGAPYNEEGERMGEVVIADNIVIPADFAN